MLSVPRRCPAMSAVPCGPTPEPKGLLSKTFKKPAASSGRAAHPVTAEGLLTSSASSPLLRSGTKLVIVDDIVPKLLSWQAVARAPMVAPQSPVDPTGKINNIEF